MPIYNMDEGSVHWLFDQSRAKVQFFGGGFGNGKTTAVVVLKALKWARDYPGCNGLIARATYPKLNDTIRKEFFRWCPKDWIKKMPTIDDNTCYLKNGSVINFRYISQRGKKDETGSTTSNLLSATYDWIIVDQVEDPEITHKDIMDLFGRLRGQTPYRPGGNGLEPEDPTMPSSGPRVLVLTSNPTGNWVYTEIIKPLKAWQRNPKNYTDDKLWIDPDEPEKGPIIDLFEGSTMINAKNLPADYIKGLRITYKGQMYDRYVMGKWAAYEGLVYPDWDSDKHLISEAKIVEYIRHCQKRHVRFNVIEGYDFGLTSPSCWMVAIVDEYGRVIIVDGFYQGGAHYADQVRERTKVLTRWEHFFVPEKPIRADPAIWKTKSVGNVINPGETMASLLHGLGWRLTPAENEITSGVAKVGSYLAGLPTVPCLTDPEAPVSGPLLYVNSKLDWFEKEITSYYWKKNPQGQNEDRPQEHNDHAMDTLKYLLSKQPDAAKIEIPKRLQVQPFMFWREEEDA